MTTLPKLATVVLWLGAVFVLVAGSARWYLKFHPRELWPVRYRYVTITNYVTVEVPQQEHWTNTTPLVYETVYVTNVYATNLYTTYR